MGLSGPVGLALAAVFLNGLPFGVLTVLYPLYLHSAGIDAGTIGQYLSLISLVGVVVLLIAGPIADHIGRRPVLLAGSFLTAAGSFTLAAGTDARLLLLGGILGTGGLTGGLGKAFINSSFNPFLAALAGEKHTTQALTGAEFAWASSAALGALAAGAPAVLPAMIPIREAVATRLLFWLCGTAALAALLLFLKLEEPLQVSDRGQPAFARLLREGRLPLFRLALLLGLHGAGAGAIALLPLWFTLRFQAGAGPIAFWFAVAQFMSLICVPTVPGLVRRYGLTKSAAILGLLASVCVGLIGTVSTFVAAAFLYVGRSIFSGMLWPAQHALVQHSVGPGIRATATSAALGAWTAGTMVFTLIAGMLLSAGSLVLVLELAAALFAMSSVMIWLSPDGIERGERDELRVEHARPGR